MVDTKTVVRAAQLSRYLTPGKLTNLYRYNRDLKHRVLRTESFPPSLAFQVSGYCNTNCQLCPVGVKTAGPEKGFMEFEVFRNIIDEAKHRLISVYFGDWGEPFLNPEIWEMIEYADRNRVTTSASTALHFFKKESDLQKLVNSGLSSSLVVSLHGTSAQTYEAYQPGKKFDTIMERLKTLVSMYKHSKKHPKPEIRLMFAITKVNQHEIEDMKKLASDLGATCQMYSASINVRFYRDNPQKLRDMMDRWAQDDKWNLLSNGDFYKKTEIQKVYEALRRQSSLSLTELDELELTGRHFCSDPWRSFVVNWDGTISLCCVDWNKYRMGDTKSESILGIWNNEEYVNARKHLLDQPVNLSPDHPCPDCVMF